MINPNDPSYQQIRAVIAYLMNNKEIPLQAALKLFSAVADNLEREYKSLHDRVHKSVIDIMNNVPRMSKRSAG